MLRCCEPPRDSTGPLFDASSRPISAGSLAPFLEAQASRPAVHHVGNRGSGGSGSCGGPNCSSRCRKSSATARHPGTPTQPPSTWGCARRCCRASRGLSRSPPPRITRAERAVDPSACAFAALVLLGLARAGPGPGAARADLGGPRANGSGSASRRLGAVAAGPAGEEGRAGGPARETARYAVASESSGWRPS